MDRLVPEILIFKVFQILGFEGINPVFHQLVGDRLPIRKFRNQLMLRCDCIGVQQMRMFDNLFRLGGQFGIGHSVVPSCAQLTLTDDSDGKPFTFILLGENHDE